MAGVALGVGDGVDRGVGVANGFGCDFVADDATAGLLAAFTGIAFIIFGDSSGLIVSLITSVAGF